MQCVLAMGRYPIRPIPKDVVDEVDGVGLGVSLVNFQRLNPRCVIDSCILKTANLFTLLASKR